MLLKTSGKTQYVLRCDLVPHARIVEISLSGNNLTGNLAGNLADDNSHRLKRVLRLREGDSFVVTDGKGREIIAKLGNDSNFTFNAEDWKTPNREPKVEVTVFAAVSKGDRLEWLIEKSVEMGVKRIVPVMAERCVVREPSRAKIERWQKVATAAMLQCGGCILPEVAAPVTIKEIAKPDLDTLAILLHEEALSTSLHQLPSADSKQKIWLASGPEGGFSSTEVNSFFNAGWQPVWLGKRLFKTDTAPTIALANLLAHSWGI